MIWLVIGLLLWIGLHLFKRLAPRARAGMGNSGRGLVAAGSLLGLVLMIIGYRMAEPGLLWALGGWARHLNNLLMVIAVLLFGLSHSKSRLRGKIRHPMLASVIVWAIAHLMVNGDVPSLVLFGGLGLWAALEMVLINRAEPKWTPPKGSARSDLIWLIVSAVVFVVIVGIHYLLGYPPFPMG